MMKKYQSQLKPLLVLTTAATLVACGGSSNSSSNNNEDRSYEVTITNATAGQPLSPPALILHGENYQSFIEGSAASIELEQLAEGGAAEPLVTNANANSAVLTTGMGAAPILPGQAASYTLSVEISDAKAALQLTALTMLVNTNDAFTGTNGVTLNDLAVGQSQSWGTPVWDSGTEANSEALGSIPGPIDTSDSATKGFDEVRNDTNDRVVFHAGVLTQGNGLQTSILTPKERFDQPAARVKITRAK